jgi:hypothetical protein
MLRRSNRFHFVPSNTSMLPIIARRSYQFGFRFLLGVVPVVLAARVAHRPGSFHHARSARVSRSPHASARRPDTSTLVMLMVLTSDAFASCP